MRLLLTIVALTALVGATTAFGDQSISRAQRFAQAQVAYQTGQYGAAKHHLRILKRSSRDADELKHLQAAFGTALAASPWSFGLNASFLPSTNINKTSSNEVFHTPLGTFQITDGGAEKSVVGLRLGARATHETMLPNGVALSYGLEINRSQFSAKRLNRTDGSVSLSWG